MDSSRPSPPSGSLILWPCPQCHSVNVKVVGPPEQLWPYVWARCEDCHEVWPAQEIPAPVHGLVPAIN